MDEDGESDVRGMLLIANFGSRIEFFSFSHESLKAIKDTWLMGKGTNASSVSCMPSP